MTNPNNSASSSISFSFIQPIELDRTNYLVWRAQVHALIIANGLESLINGDLQCPNHFLAQTYGKSSISKAQDSNGHENPDFINWKEIDKLIQS